MPSYCRMDGTTQPLHCNCYLIFGRGRIECGAFGAGIQAGVASRVGERTVGPLWIAGVTGKLSATIRAVTVSPTEQTLLESLLQRLLPTPVGSSPDVTPIPSQLELLLQRLLGDDRRNLGR